MIIQFKDMVSREVLWEKEYKLTIDGAAVLPREGDWVVLPPSREERRVRKVVRKYGEQGLRKVEVTLL